MDFERKLGWDGGIRRNVFMSNSPQTPPRQTEPPTERRPSPEPVKTFEFKDWAMI
jgi:hypothetical protein